LFLQRFVVYLKAIMARTKIATGKSGVARGGSKGMVRDIKPKSVRDVFTIRQVNPEDDVSDEPTVEPLIEDSDEQNENEEVNIEETIMEVERIEPEIDYQPARPPRMNVTSLEDDQPSVKVQSSEDFIPKETIKVKFGKFVHLVANHDFADVIEAHADDEIVMSSNLLTDLAGASDKKEERKIPLVLMVGIIIGGVLTYIFFSQ
jgi:hypothetical protein